MVGYYPWGWSVPLQSGEKSQALQTHLRNQLREIEKSFWDEFMLIISKWDYVSMRKLNKLNYEANLSEKASISEAVLMSEVASKDSFNRKVSMRASSINSSTKKPQWGSLNMAVLSTQWGRLNATAKIRLSQWGSLNEVIWIWQSKLNNKLSHSGTIYLSQVLISWTNSLGQLA